jgi:hypothetical protein
MTVSQSKLVAYGFIYLIANMTEDKSVQAVCLYPKSEKGTVIHFRKYVAIAKAIVSYNNT